MSELKLKTTKQGRIAYKIEHTPLILWNDREDGDWDLGVSDFDLIDDIETLLAENQKLRDALTFYASEANWSNYDPSHYDVHLDRGERARKALE